MGFGSLIGNIFDFAAEPAIRAATGDPIGAVMSVSKQGKLTSQELENRRSAQMFTQDPGQMQGLGGMNVSTSSGGSGGFFSNLGQTIGGFGRDVGGFFSDIRPATDLFGINLPGGGMAPGGAQTIIRQRPDETSTSGEILGANLGLGSNLIQAATRFARSPGGGTALGFGAGALGAALGGGSDGKPRITRS